MTRLAKRFCSNVQDGQEDWGAPEKQYWHVLNPGDVTVYFGTAGDSAECRTLQAYKDAIEQGHGASSLLSFAFASETLHFAL